MRKLLTIFLVSFTILSWHGSASAGLKFGTDESIRFVANITLKGPAGERLYLARKITTKSFLLPYTVKDDGFVIGISGESKKYFPMPQGERLLKLQEEGYLPNPLPAYTLETLDWAFGHALWLTLIGLLIYWIYKGMRQKSRLANAGAAFTENTASTQTHVSQYIESSYALPMKFEASRGKAVWLLLGAITFVALGLFVAGKDPTLGYTCVAFFGLGIPVALIQMMPGASGLELKQHTFTTTSLFRKTTTAWRDVDHFVIRSMRSRKMVMWNYVPEYAARRTGAGFSKALIGAHAALPETYGMSAEKLAAIMNSVKQRSLAAGR